MRRAVLGLAGLLAAAYLPVAGAATVTAQPPVEKARHEQFLARLGGVDESAVRAARVEAVAKRLLAASDLSRCNCTFEFFVVRTGDAVAYSMTGGYVYISPAMLQLTATESELAAVLAHEMAHLALGHAILRQQVFEGGGDPSEKAAELDALGRAMEFEADAFGIRMLAAAGFDPGASARLLERMGAVMAKAALQATQGGTQYSSAIRSTIRERAGVAAAIAGSLSSGG